MYWDHHCTIFCHRIKLPIELQLTLCYCSAAWGYHRQGYCQAGFAAAATKVEIHTNCRLDDKIYIKNEPTVLTAITRWRLVVHTQFSVGQPAILGRLWSYLTC